MHYSPFILHKLTGFSWTFQLGQGSLDFENFINPVIKYSDWKTMKHEAMHNAESVYVKHFILLIL